MMKVRDIQFGSHGYPFHHGVHCAGEIVEQLVALGADRYVIVVDEVVAPLHLQPIAEGLARHAPV